MTGKVCIYHGDCADGFGAAWVVRRAFGEDVEFVAGRYQSPPPDLDMLAGKDLYIVDFSYKRPVMEEIIKRVRSLTVLDHHKTAQAELEELSRSSLLIRFDMDRSGAGLAWDYFFPLLPRPKLIDHLEDRDLWRFALPGTREIQAAVFSYPYDFTVWDVLMQEDPEVLRKEGASIERKHLKDVEELVRALEKHMRIGGYWVPTCNLPHVYASDAGHLMCKNHPEAPFAACWYDTADGRSFSLRSIGDFDVSAVAAEYGGGGHRNAAGFRLKPE
jgi:oligoribonuclease NrnB/cAMP/cGMP phosphodiesterase (DHH superfamily)